MSDHRGRFFLSRHLHGAPRQTSNELGGTGVISFLSSKTTRLASISRSGKSFWALVRFAGVNRALIWSEDMLRLKHSLQHSPLQIPLAS